MFPDPNPMQFVNPTALIGASFAGTGSVTQDFVCTGRGPTSSTYRYTISSSHYIDLLISRQVSKRSRYTVRFTESELVADPINSELNAVKTSTIYVVADIGVLGIGTNWQKMLNALAVNFLVKPTDDPQAFDQVLAGET